MSPTITLARLTGDSSCFIFKRVMPIKKCALPLLLQQRESESAFLGRFCNRRRRRDAVRELPHECEQALGLLDLREVTSLWDEFEASVGQRLGVGATVIRVCDAIALALRVGASIFVDEEVVLKAKNVEVTKERDLGKGLAEDQTTIKNWLDSIKPGDFGKIERGKEPGQDE